MAKDGGERGIRTPGTLTGSVVFKTTAIDHSAISPRRLYGLNLHVSLMLPPVNRACVTGSVTVTLIRRLVGQLYPARREGPLRRTPPPSSQIRGPARRQRPQRAGALDDKLEESPASSSVC